MGTARKTIEPAANDRPGEGDPLLRLAKALKAQRTGNVRHARTLKLLAAGRPKMAQKVIEEAGEVALAAVGQPRERVVHESADLLYHLAVLWFELGIQPSEIWAEMGRRETLFGISAKIPKRFKQTRHPPI